MKRLIAGILAVLMLCGIAVAEDNLQVSDRRVITVEDDDDVVVYAFARVNNIGEQAVRVKDGHLIVSEGKEAEDTDTFSAYMSYLQPGEYTYARFKLKLEKTDDISAVTDTMMSFGEGEVRDHAVMYYISDGAYVADDQTMYARVTNNSAETVYGIKTVFALKDADENLLYVDSCNMLSKVGLEPGSTVSVKCKLPDVIKDYLKDNGFTPVSVDAIAYTIDKEESDD